MNILSIETSCDETAVSIVYAIGKFPEATYETLGDALHSQINLHAQYGGVFPMMAKREHILRILPLTKKALTEAELLTEEIKEISIETKEKIYEILYREKDLADELLIFAETHEKPEIDLLAVTSGPGLEPALWVGVNFAKALAYLWNIPTVSVNHMEGHILASIFDMEEDDKLSDIVFPTIALLISGGHTELILMKKWGTYEKIGQTRDDAVGEAFDKVARMMGLPYPGGPKIGKLASDARQQNLLAFVDLPRPMLNSNDLDFSFSGLKTAVRYAIADIDLTENNIQSLARDFEDAVVEVLIKKTAKAIEQYEAKTLIVGGGVSANKQIQQEFNKYFLQEFSETTVYFPHQSMSTDNSIMIALAGHARAQSALAPAGAELIKADGNRSLSQE